MVNTQQKNPAAYDFQDGSKPVKASDLRSHLADKANRKQAAKLLGRKGAFNLRVKAWAGQYIQKKFFNRFKVTKKGGIADGVKEKTSNAKEKLKATTQKLLKKIPGMDTLTGMSEKIKTKVNAKTKKAKKGGVAYTVASVGCIALKAPAFISAGIAGAQLMRLLPIVNELVLSPGSKLKASGVDTANAISPDDVEAIGSLLTNKTEDSDGNMTSALDSQYLQAAMGINKNKPPVSEKLTPGYNALMNDDLRDLRELGKASEPTCNFILSPTGMFTFLVVESAITKTNPLGAAIGLVAGFVIGPLISEVAGNVIGMVGEAVIKKLAESDALDNLEGRELGDAIGISASAFFSSGAMARNIPVLSKEQSVAFQAMKNENEQFHKEMDIASLSPFDTSSRYTFMGSIVYSAQMAALQNGGSNSALSLLGSLMQLPKTLLTQNASAAEFTQNSCGYAEEFDLIGKDDTPGVNVAGLPCTGITPEQAAMSSEQATDILAGKEWLDTSIDIDENDTIIDLVDKKVIKEDTPLAAYVESCGDASSGDYLYETTGCMVPKSVQGGQAQEDEAGWAESHCFEESSEEAEEGEEEKEPVNTCAEEGISATSTGSTDDTLAYTAMAVFLLDFQLAQSINGEDEETADTSSNPAGFNGETVQYYQCDEPWANELFGRLTMCRSGCGPSTFASVVSSFYKGTPVTPTQMAQFFADHDGISEGGGSNWIWGSNPGAFESSFGITTETVAPSAENARRGISEGGLVVISVGNKTQFTPGGHIMMIRGVVGDNFLVGTSSQKAQTEKATGFAPSDFYFGEERGTVGMWIIKKAEMGTIVRGDE